MLDYFNYISKLALATNLGDKRHLIEETFSCFEGINKSLENVQLIDGLINDGLKDLETKVTCEVIIDNMVKANRNP